MSLAVASPRKALAVLVSELYAVFSETSVTTAL